MDALPLPTSSVKAWKAPLQEKALGRDMKIKYNTATDDRIAATCKQLQQTAHWICVVRL